MKIKCFRQLCAERTDGQTDTQSDSLGSLTEPKSSFYAIWEMDILERKQILNFIVESKLISNDNLR